MEGPNGINIDKELSDIIAKKGLLEHPGFKQYMTLVYSFYKYKESQILEFTKMPLTSERVDVLNLLIAERNSLESLLLVSQEIKDSLNSSEETLNLYEGKYDEQ